VIATRLPPTLPARRVHVVFKPYALRVSDAATGTEYLAGRLERGVSPRDCTWTYERGGGEGEGATLLLLLAKTNLELAEAPWWHSATWWPRLFQDDAAIAADDYGHDYSDLPFGALEARAKEQAAQEAARRVDGADRAARTALQVCCC
jgi:hypothetical protein